MRRSSSWDRLLSLLVVCGAKCGVVEGFASSLRDRLPGIWRLVTDGTLPPLLVSDESISKELPLADNLRVKKSRPNDSRKSSLVLIICEDGSFRQSTDRGFRAGRRAMSGTWEVLHEERSRLVLAMDRQAGAESDVILEGSLSASIDATTVVFEGEVYKGRFMYPRSHPSFYDELLVGPKAIGSFSLEQTVAARAIQESASDEGSTVNAGSDRFKASDFHGRRFYMTIEPLLYESNEEDSALDPSVDIRAMPLHFYANNTFQAWGVNKVLRGRFSVANAKLTFDVSLFGAGRSMKGSVFSDGVGLSHEDKRSYVGNIQEAQGRLYVDGAITFGADLGTDARPEPVGRFLLTEITETNKWTPYDASGCDDALGSFQ